jgi:type II secretory pathway component PulF
MHSLAGALAEIRAPREKAAFYRMMHLQVRAGLRWDQVRSPGTPVPFETALLRLGAEAGKLEETTRLLADYFAADYRALQTVLRHATYPMFTALAATFIAPLPLAFFGHIGAYLVTVTVGSALWFAAGGGLLLGTVRRYLRQPKYVLGRLLRALTFGIESGLTLAKAVALAVDAADDPVITRHVGAQGAQRVGSQPLAATFRGCPGLPFEAIASMEVAEASGDFTGALKKLADLYES